MQRISLQILINAFRGLIIFGLSFQAFALNPIQIENAITSSPGDNQWNTFASPIVAHTIEGYADQTSVSPGNSIKFYVHSNAALNSNYTLTVYRLGYYSGIGARRMTTPVVLPSVNQTMPTPDPVTGLTECTWINPYTLTIPANWTSGVYIATIVGNTTNTGSNIIFVVKQPASTAAYVFQTSDTTWQAYNAWGGKSLYTYNSTNNSAAVKVSYNRPYDSGNGMGDFTAWELQNLRFLEKNGYDVTYQSNIDTHLGGVTQLVQHKAFLSVGHDEYWSKAIRDNVENARSRGLSLGFFGANAAYWQIRLENSLLNAAANRTIVGYKELAANDPIGTPALVTAQWRDPLYANRSENGLIGIQYVFNPVNSNIIVSNANHWVYTGTGLVNGSVLTGLLGYEVDAFVSNGFAPAGLSILAHSPANANGVFSDVSIYTQTCTVTPCTNSTATVFATGSMQWNWGLDRFYVDTNLENAAVQQITHNVLARMLNPNANLPALPPNANSIAPSFVGGTTNLTVLQNSGAVDLKANIQVSDTDQGQTLTWSQTQAPQHGNLVISGATATSGSTNISPAGTITYQPNASYSGSDSFSIQVSDGTDTATRVFNVTVSSSGLGPNLLINPSLEQDANNDAVPDCWSLEGYGTNSFSWTRTNDSHSGSFAEQLQMTAFTSGDRKLLSTLDNGQSAGGCAPSVQVGLNYQIGVFYKSTTEVLVVLFYLDANNVWQYWKNAPTRPASSTWSQITFDIGALPTGAKAVTFGLALAGVGTLVTDDYSFVQILNNPSSTSKQDFNNDKKSDILWRNTSTGDNYLYLMNGSSISNPLSISNVGSTWAIKGNGDFNGDGIADILWRNTTTGDNYLYLMNGNVINSILYINTVPTAWDILSTDDFNGDGKADILWRSNTGDNFLYLMNSNTITNALPINTVSPAWTIKGTGDFNGDGKADILWRNSASGDNYLYLMNSNIISNALYINNVPSAWDIKSTGDFNGDGKADILWRNNSSGDNYLYLMNSNIISNAQYINKVANTWDIKASGDYNGDGKADIFWRNNNGDNYIYLMDSATISSATFLNTVSNLNWTVIK